MTMTSDVDPALPTGRHRFASGLTTRTWTALVLLVVLAVGGGVIAWHATRSDPASTADAVLPTDSNGHLHAAVDLLGVHLEPVATDRRARLTATAATALCFNPTVGCDHDGGPVTAVLALATTDSNGLIQPDGSIKRTIDNTFVWALTWRSECFSSGGPPPLPGQSPAPPPQPQTCTNLVVMDADSGNPLFDGSGNG